MMTPSRRRHDGPLCNVTVSAAGRRVIGHDGKRVPSDRRSLAAGKFTEHPVSGW